MIEIKDFSYRYKKSGENVFDNFSLSLSQGHVYGLLGRNGVGKSTLIYSIMGMLQPRSGLIAVDCYDSSKRYADMLADCFLVPEEFEMPDCSLNQYVKLISPFYPNFSKDNLLRNLELFNISGNPNLKALSMGQKKKVFMCFALAANTRYLIMDEPTNGLDIPSKEQFRQLVRTVSTVDHTIIISTHQVADIEALLDEVIILERNKVMLKASVSDIIKRLKFGVNEPDAIYSQPFAGGDYTISPNPTGEPSALRLELLFNAVLTKPELRNMF